MDVFSSISSTMKCVMNLAMSLQRRDRFVPRIFKPNKPKRPPPPDSLHAAQVHDPQHDGGLHAEEDEEVHRLRQDPLERRGDGVLPAWSRGEQTSFITQLRWFP